MTTLALLLVVAVAATLLFRRQWLAYAHQRYLFQLSWYILARQMPDDTIVAGMPEGVTYQSMLLDIGHWDFGRYVDYGLYWDVQEFFADEANLVGLPERQREKAETASKALTMSDEEMDQLLKEVLAEQDLTAETLHLSDEQFDAALVATEEKRDGLARLDAELDATKAEAPTPPVREDSANPEIRS